MSNYPPGVTGNEPEITGEWPCSICHGAGYDEDEDGKHNCLWCGGSGIEPEIAPYCLHCGKPTERTEKFFHNSLKNDWKCEDCFTVSDNLDPNWEEV